MVGSHKWRKFSVGDQVRVLCPPHKANKWEVGTVAEVCGTKRYLVDISGRVRSVHVDHMIMAKDDPCSAPLSVVDTNPDHKLFDHYPGPTTTSVEPKEPQPLGSKTAPAQNKPNLDQPPEIPLRTSQRLRKPVVKLNL